MDNQKLLHNIRNEWNKDRGFGNYFTRLRQIPIGFNSFKGRSHHKIITIPEELGSNVTLIVGCPGSGKTTIMKNIYSWQAQFFHRPVVIIDPLGVEHHLSKKKNSQPYGILRKFNDEKIQEPFGIENLNAYSPMFAQEDVDVGDITYGFYPTDLDVRDWTSLDMSEGAAAIIDEICSRNPNVAKDITNLYEFIRGQPRSHVSAAAQGQEFFIHASTHDSLMKSLRILDHAGFFTKDETLRLQPKDIIEKIKKETVCLKFFGENKYCRSYLGIIMNHIYNARVKRKIPPPVVAIDEADSVAPAFDKKYDFGSTYQCVKYVRRGRKQGMSMIFATQRFNSLHEDVCDFYKYLIVGGSLTSTDLKRVSYLTNPEIVDVVKRLRFDPSRGIREQLLIRSDRSYDSFWPFNCPVEMYREAKYSL